MFIDTITLIAIIVNLLVLLIVLTKLSLICITVVWTKYIIRKKQKEFPTFIPSLPKVTWCYTGVAHYNMIDDIIRVNISVILKLKLKYFKNIVLHELAHFLQCFYNPVKLDRFLNVYSGVSYDKYTEMTHDEEFRMYATMIGGSGETYVPAHYYRWFMQWYHRRKPRPKGYKR